MKNNIRQDIVSQKNPCLMCNYCRQLGLKTTLPHCRDKQTWSQSNDLGVNYMAVYQKNI